MLDANPIAGVKRSKVEDESRVRFLDADEEQRLRDALAEARDRNGGSAVPVATRTPPRADVRRGRSGPTTNTPTTWRRSCCWR